MALTVQINAKQNFSLEERVFYSADPGKLIFRYLGYTDQDKAKRVSKRCLNTILALQRAAIEKAYPSAHLNLVGGSVEALRRLPIRNIPIPINPPKQYKFPDLAVGWTKIRPKKEGEQMTWRLHVYKQEISDDKTLKNMVAIYFGAWAMSEKMEMENVPPFIGIWSVENACCSRNAKCCWEKYSCQPWTCWLQIAFCFGCTTTLPVGTDFLQKHTMNNLKPIPEMPNKQHFIYEEMPYMPFLGLRQVIREKTDEKSEIDIRRHSNAKVDIPSYMLDL